MPRRFWSRSEAGTLLARELVRFGGGAPGPIILAIPPGGVPVAYEVARKLDAPLDVLAAIKLTVPGEPDRTMGAVARGGVRVLDSGTIHELGVTPALAERVAADGEAELARREHAFRGWNRPLDLRGRTAILVDECVDTGSTMNAAVLSARRHGAERVIVATPVAAPASRAALARSVREVVCLYTPQPFPSVQACYDQFPNVTDEDVRDLLQHARAEVSNTALFDIFSSFAGAS